MHYSVQQGIHTTWSDRVRAVPRVATWHNWLPLAVASITALWVGLVFVNITQKTPMIPGVPSSVGQVTARLPMTDPAPSSVHSGHVTMQTTAPSGANIHPSHKVSSIPMRSPAVTTVTTMITPPATPMTNPEMTVGGYGADESPLTSGGTDVNNNGPADNSAATNDPADNTTSTTENSLITAPVEDNTTENKAADVTTIPPVVAPIIVDIAIPNNTPITTSL